MALLSRSLRPVRQTTFHTDDNGLVSLKKHNKPNENVPHRGKGSSDCLDTTTQDIPTDTSKARHVNPSLATRPRTSTRRNHRSSSASIDTVASPSQLKIAGNSSVNGNGVSQTPRGVPDIASATDSLRDGCESPDPLDTISPAPVEDAAKLRSGASVQAGRSESIRKSPITNIGARHNDPDPKTDPGKKIKTEGNELAVPEARPADATRSHQKPKTEPIPDQHAGQSTERRSLRSGDSGSKTKSELAQYFYNYEQIICLDDPKPETLAANTLLTLVDDLSEKIPPPSKIDSKPFGNPLKNLYNCQIVTLPKPSSRNADPLGEDLYFRAHRKFERQEKQLRNIERDRAQHEKEKVDRLLDDLRGQDWLRIMGLTGVHESEKKLYEPKRKILIQELVAVVNKFQAWKDEERRRKLAREKPPAEDAEAESHSSRKRARPEDEKSTPGSGIGTPDPSDVDALAARQLHQEARTASATRRPKSMSSTRKPKSEPVDNDNITPDQKRSIKRQKRNYDASPSPLPTVSPTAINSSPPDDKPFTSYLKDPNQRATAVVVMNGTSHSPSQPIIAFGQPIPEIEEQEFAPPSDLLTEEAIKASQRQRRRLKRQSQS
ncbi:hypothetical protein N7495_004648 [Penicillium taxi]|uniref:uncharacterized protein n=1 Tax=Penicillium taxi TaxID=168475 RepID=UPI0025456B98|nr:uncharacterized protein N7495_004648 [Penicillium taxi]KAJ5899904.1 hypothetical protein N7495_004648 [Penicillium taxi]